MTRVSPGSRIDWLFSVGLNYPSPSVVSSEDAVFLMEDTGIKLEPQGRVSFTRTGDLNPTHEPTAARPRGRLDHRIDPLLAGGERHFAD